MLGLVGKIHIDKLDIPLKLYIFYAPVLLRALPGPEPGADRGLGNLPVAADFGIDQSHRTIVNLGRLSHEGKHPVGPGQTHNN